MSIIFQFTPTKDDYVYCISDFSATIQKALSITIGLFIPFMLYFGFSNFIKYASIPRGDWSTPYIALFTFPLCATIILFFMRYFYDRQIGKQVKTSTQFISPVSWQMDDTQIIVKTDFSETKMNWNMFQKTIEYERFYLLVQTANKRCFNIVPKRVFESTAQEESFRALIEQKLGKIQNDIKLKRITIPVLKITGVMILWGMAITSVILLYIQ